MTHIHQLKEIELSLDRDKSKVFFRCDECNFVCSCKLGEEYMLNGDIVENVEGHTFSEEVRYRYVTAESKRNMHKNSNWHLTCITSKNRLTKKSKKRIIDPNQGEL